MKTRFSEGDFLTLLETTTEFLKVLVSSQQYQVLSNSLYYSSVDFTLVDAVQALEQAQDAYAGMECESVLSPSDKGIEPQSTTEKQGV